MNVNKIRGRLAEMELTQKDIAKRWGCTVSNVSMKLKGKRTLYLWEAVELAKLLKLTDEEKVKFFFA